MYQFRQTQSYPILIINFEREGKQYANNKDVYHMSLSTPKYTPNVYNSLPNMKNMIFLQLYHKLNQIQKQSKNFLTASTAITTFYEKRKRKESQLEIPIEMNETIYRATQMQVQDTISDKDTSTRTQVNLMKSKNAKRQDDKRAMLWSL